MPRLKELVEDYQVLRSAIPFLDKYAPKARRWSWLWVFLLLVFITPAFGELVSITGHFTLLKFQALFALNRAEFWFAIFRHFGWLALWGSVCAIAAYLYCVAQTVFIKNVFGITGEKTQSMILVEQLQDRMGVEHLYPSIKKDLIRSQPYAMPMIAAVGMTKKVRLLSIAGFEYIGRGTDSLLYTVIECHPELNAQVILLNPEAGRTTIDRRVSELKTREQTITAEGIIHNIQMTTDALKTLNATRKGGRVELRQCQWHPIFRLLLCDEVMFFSTYGHAMHGHESPVIQITKRSRDGSSSDTHYHSWDCYFESVWEHSRPISLT